MTLILFTTMALLALHIQGGAAADERALFSALFDTAAGYNTNVRPRLDPSTPVDVSLELELGQIQDLNEKDQILSTVGFITAIWNDEFLSWEPEDYGGMDMLVIPSKYVWLPDFGVGNSAGSFYDDAVLSGFRVQLFHTGNISWSFGGVFNTICRLDNTYYPIDLQHCKLHLENWAYTGEQVNLHNVRSEVDRNNYKPHGIWEISKTWTEKELHSYSSHPGETFPEVIFHLYLKRKSTYYVLNILLPCALIVVVALTVYWLPPDAGEKVSFGVTVLLAFSVFQLVIADRTPVNSDYSPKLTLLVLAIMGLSSFSVVISILILRLHHKNTATRVPRWLRVLAFRGLATVLCMRSGMPEIDDGLVKVIPNDVNITNGVAGKQGKMTTEMADIAENLEYITNNMKEKENNDKILEEWRSLGRVIDRCLFWVSLIVIVIIGSVLLGKGDPDH